MVGKNLDKVILTLGPTNLSAIILLNNSAAFARTVGLVELQNKSRRYINAPKTIQRVHNEQKRMILSD